ncbi:MAG: nucleotide-binding protein [Eubacteriales bacterium]
MSAHVSDGNVFIVWGGNKDLADAVGAELNKTERFCGVVGGQFRTQQLVNLQVMEQIQNCSYAIILVKNIGEDKISFNPNLMYEWGYIVAKYNTENVCPIVIDLDIHFLPSDLKGCWADSVSSEGKSVEELAKEIVTLFVGRELDLTHKKMELLLNWRENKGIIEQHLTNPSHSNFQIANIILHSIQAAYYNHDLLFFQQTLELLLPKSNATLRSILTVALNVTNFYITTDNQQNTQKVYELEQILQKLESVADTASIEAVSENMDKLQLDVMIWKNLILFDFIGVCHMVLAESDPEHLFEAKEAFEQAIVAMERWQKEFPAVDDDYVNLWEGYIYRNLAVITFQMDEKEDSSRYFAIGKKARQSSFAYFTESNNQALTVNFNLEYLLIQVEEMVYFPEVSQKSITRRISRNLRMINEDYKKQHALLGLVQKEMDKISIETGGA